MEKLKENKIVMIPVEKIYPHPDNPRKALGDLTELTESIKAQGVLQNLTVVPYSSVYDTEAPDGDTAYSYVTLIGHRRCAAAKAAGLTHVPCVISNMELRDQVGIMLLENLQRADLTVYEQAKGFQLMMDMGSTVQEISDLTGFAERTVQRRLQIATLDEELFSEKMLEQLSLNDYVQLSRIRNEKERKRCATYAGTSSFKWTVESVLREQALKDDVEKVKPLLKAAGYTKYDKSGNPIYNGDYERIWEEKPAEIVKAGALPVTTKDTTGAMWYVYNDRITLLKRNEKKKEKKSAKRAKAEQLNAEMNKLNDRMFTRRHEFIKNFAADAKYKKVIERAYLEYSLREMCQDRGSCDYQLLYDLTGTTPVSKWHRPYSRDILAVLDEGHGLAYVTWVLTGDSKEMGPYWDGYGEEMPKWRGESDKHVNALRRVYRFLMQLGYEAADEELQFINGTHRLYKGKTSDE